MPDRLPIDPTRPDAAIRRWERAKGDQRARINTRLRVIGADKLVRRKAASSLLHRKRAFIGWQTRRARLQARALEAATPGNNEVPGDALNERFS